MEPLKIATVQFETRDNDKVYNLSVIREMCRKASVEGADVVAFHECSVCGYTFAKDLSREELLAIAEPIPTGESTQALIAIAKEFGVTLLAGFFERDGDRIYKAQVCVDGNGLKAKYRKLHPFINPNILPGDQYVVFEIKGWKCGILICYDNNIRIKFRTTGISVTISSSLSQFLRDSRSDHEIITQFTAFRHDIAERIQNHRATVLDLIIITPVVRNFMRILSANRMSPIKR